MIDDLSGVIGDVNYLGLISNQFLKRQSFGECLLKRLFFVTLFLCDLLR
jgi:hypothetical protein